jgi:DNA-binding response OmpR family regulator
MTSVLLIEDDPTLSALLSEQLRLEGYETTACADGEKGLQAARSHAWDLFLVDVMLPKLDGLSLCRIITKESESPVLLLTARGTEADRVIGLDSGAHDYIVKPFGMPELLARVRAALRRAGRRAAAVMRVGEVVVDTAARRVWVGDREVKLSLKEYELLSVLLRHRGAALTRDFLISQVWGVDFAGDTRTLDVHMRWLRQKIETDPSAPQLLQTVRGVGYRID